MLLASDPSSSTSAAALDIRVGSFSDPPHLQGLAHLCEHVLFTGSEEYPNESYSEFLGKYSFFATKLPGNYFRIQELLSPRSPRRELQRVHLFRAHQLSFRRPVQPPQTGPRQIRVFLRLSHLQVSVSEITKTLVAWNEPYSLQRIERPERAGDRAERA